MLRMRLVCDGNAVDVGCEVFQGCGGIVDRLAVDHPVLLPNMLWDLVEKRGFL